MGTCVGKRNYRYFFAFLVLLLALAALMLAQVIILLHDEGFDRIGYAVANIIEGVCIVGGLLFVGVMLGFHCYISSKNITTNEYCKRMW